MVNYVNLDILITFDPDDKKRYLVSARTRQEGPKLGSFDPSFLEEWYLLEPILVALDARREETSQNEQAIQDFGSKLFRSVFKNEILALYDKISRRSDGMQIRLTIVPLELVVLPWELMFDKRQPGYLGYLCLMLQPKIVLVRCINNEKRTRTAKYDPPLRILGMYAEPNGYNKLRYKEEQKAISEALALLTKEEMISVEWKPGIDETLYKLHMTRSAGMHFTLLDTVDFVKPKHMDNLSSGSG